MCKILIVDDDKNTIFLLTDILKNSGYEVFGVTNARQALDIITHETISLILLDLRLPGMNGWEMASILQRDPQTAAIPIIAVSVEIETDDSIRALQMGCVAYIAKPFDIIYLRREVAHHIR